MHPYPHRSIIYNSQDMIHVTNLGKFSTIVQIFLPLCFLLSFLALQLCICCILKNSSTVFGCKFSTPPPHKLFLLFTFQFRKFLLTYPQADRLYPWQWLVCWWTHEWHLLFLHFLVYFSSFYLYFKKPRDLSFGLDFRVQSYL